MGIGKERGRDLDCARPLIKIMSASVRTKLDETIRTGAFLPVSEKENLEEEWESLAGPELPACSFWAAHPLDSMKREGLLRDEKEQMLDALA